MILYFSGTGNSRYVAEVIGKTTSDEIVSVNDLIKKGKLKTLSSDRPFVFVCPTYSWRIPRILEEFINKTTFTGNRNVYFILTYGDSDHGALHYVKRLCKKKDFILEGYAGVIMPENYIAMFNAPDKSEADLIIQKALPQILILAEQIKKKQPFPKVHITQRSRVKSLITNPLFYITSVSAKGFYSTNTCISCGKCQQVCPLNNVTLVNEKPQWGNKCTHCMACICACPKEAIEYKNKTQGKHRFYNNEHY